MKWITVGIGTERRDNGTRRFVVDFAVQSDKPVSRFRQNIVWGLLVVALFGASIYALDRTDVPDTVNTATVWR